jgi:ABC-type Fe3+ transport system permease subunit
MSLLTLGMTSARDSIYEDAAAGLWERPSVILLPSFLLIAFVFFIVGLLSDYPRQPPLKQSPESARDEARELAKWRRINFYLTLVLCFSFALLFVKVLFVGYTNTAVAAFNQQLARATPYLTPEQRNMLLARLASIKSRQDFVAVLHELNEVARSHGQPASRFSPW